MISRALSRPLADAVARALTQSGDGSTPPAGAQLDQAGDYELDQAGNVEQDQTA